MIAFYLVLAILSTAVVWKGCVWLEASSEALSQYYRLPPIVQGAIVVAIGSSFPELAAVVVSALIHDEFELGIAAVVGSALFNIMIIPALAVLVGRDAMQSNRDLVYKEAQFYMIAVAVLLLTFSFAVIYNPVEGVPGAISGTLDRKLALIPVAMYAVYLFIQYQDTRDDRRERSETPVQPRKAWGKLSLSLLVILAGVEGLVRSAIAFGDFFGTPSFLWGITIVAAGTSLPDAFVSIRAARQGNSVMSLANVLGSNVFDLLVAIPAGVLIAGAAVINYSVAAPLMGMLTLATVALFAMMRTRMRLSARESWAMLGGYAAFVAWAALESFDLIDWVPSLPP